MKKIVRQQNYLRDLIDNQDNNLLSLDSLKCLIKSVLVPLVDKPEDGVVLHRFEHDYRINGLLKRLEFSEIKNYDFSDMSGNIIEKVWANTEFICVMTHRYVSIIIWDTNNNDKNFVRYYSLYNSKQQNEPLNIINRNSKIDLSEYMTKYTPDRRDNILLNSSIRSLLANLQQMANDNVLNYAEKTSGNLIKVDYKVQNCRRAAHEIRNHLSISDLYLGIITKQLEQGAEKKDLQNSLKAVANAIQLAGHELSLLKSDNKVNLLTYNLKEILNDILEYSKAYLSGRNVKVNLNCDADIKVIADKDKLNTVFINLVKNAAEAFDSKESNDRKFEIQVEKNDDEVLIYVSNNAKGISKPEKIFEEGYTTKSSGSGLGLWICKNYMLEQNGNLELSRSSQDFTEFVITLSLAKGGRVN